MTNEIQSSDCSTEGRARTAHGPLSNAQSGECAKEAGIKPGQSEANLTPASQAVVDREVDDLASEVIIAYFDNHSINDARAGAFNILDRLKNAGLTVAHTNAAEAMREACAKVAENFTPEGKLYHYGTRHGIAAAIRALPLQGTQE